MVFGLLRRIAQFGDPYIEFGFVNRHFDHLDI